MSYHHNEVNRSIQGQQGLCNWTMMLANTTSPYAKFEFYLRDKVWVFLRILALGQKEIGMSKWNRKTFNHFPFHVVFYCNSIPTYRALSLILSKWNLFLWIFFTGFFTCESRFILIFPTNKLESPPSFLSSNNYFVGNIWPGWTSNPYNRMYGK